MWLKLDSGAAVLRTLFDCRVYDGRYHSRLQLACLDEGHTAPALGDSVALDQPLVPARNTGFPNGDYPSCGRSPWRWLSAARLSSGMASTPIRAWAMIADRFRLSGLGKYATLRAHVMSPPLPSNHLPFPATHIPDARRRWSPRHLFSSFAPSFRAALFCTYYTAVLLTTTSEEPFPCLSWPHSFSPVPHIRLASEFHLTASRQSPSETTQPCSANRGLIAHTHTAAQMPKMNMASQSSNLDSRRMAGDDVTITPALVAARCALCSAGCGRQGRQGKPGGQPGPYFRCNRGDLRRE